MSAPVRRESKVSSDPRYATLALLLGLADADHATGKMLRLYAWQTENYTDESPTYSVHRSIIIGIFQRIDSPERLVDADLAELEADGRFRIKGGRDDRGRSRIDWLWREREQRRAAGKARAAGARSAGGRWSSPPADDQREASGPPDGPAADQRETSGEPPADERRTSSPDSVLRIPDLSPPPRAIAGHPVTTAEAMHRYVDHAIDQLNLARRSIDPKSRPIALLHDQPCRELVDRLRPLAPEERMAALDHALDVLIAEARAKGTVDDLRVAMVSGERAWPRLQAATVAGVSKRRDGPGGAGNPSTPPRKVPRLA